MKDGMRTYFVAAVFGIMMLLVGLLHAQIRFGAAGVSRYVWRGHDFGDSPSMQPYLEYSKGGLTIGTLAAYPFTSDIGVNEHDVYASYAFGSLEMGVTDYFFPDGADYFDYDSDGNHVIESYVSYSGQVSFLIAANVLNDPEHSVYFELGYSMKVDDLDIALFTGGTTGSSEWYGTEGAGLLSVGLTATKEVPVTSEFSLPLFVSYILNPNAQKTYLVFGISF